MTIKGYITVMFFEEMDISQIWMFVVVQYWLAYPSECSPSVLDPPSQRLLPATE